MKPSKLIPDEWIVAYAAGSLSEAKATLVATHISFHPSLKKSLVAAENIGGALLDSNDKAAISKNLFDKITAQIEDSEKHEIPDSASPRGSLSKIISAERVPNALADYVNIRSLKPKWRYMGPGLRQAKLWNGKNGERLWLLKAAGGTEMPLHDHGGQEMTLVLQGSYHVGNTQFGVGDLEIATEHVEDHEPIIDAGEDCICLVVTEAPIKLKSFIARALQPFIGI